MSKNIGTPFINPDIGARIVNSLMEAFHRGEKITIAKQDFLNAYEGLKEIMESLGENCSISFE